MGHTTEAETGLVYMRARYYDPGTGRFVNEDPGINGRNWYAYCDGDPVDRLDKTGKSWASLITQDWGYLAAILLARGLILLFVLGPKNIREGSFMIEDGAEKRMNGASFDASLVGQLLGTAFEASGQLEQAIGQRTLIMGVIEAITGALEVLASQLIFFGGDDMGPDSIKMVEQYA